MLYPKAYHDTNANQQRIAAYWLEKFLLTIGQSELEGSAVDVGCGDGAVTAQVLSARCPRLRVAACDLSPAMLAFAKAKFTDGNIDFQLLDIASDDLPTAVEYDYLFSFFCLHQVPDHRRALGNMLKLMKNNAHCLIVFIANASCFRVNQIMAKDSKWSKYLCNNLKKIISPYQDSLLPEDEFGAKMKDVGFDVVYIQKQSLLYDFNNIETLLNMFKSVDLGGKFIPQELLEDYHTDYANVARECKSYFIENSKAKFKCDAVIAIGKKSF